jgi:GNAT superfamily N-acetyltransferase
MVQVREYIPADREAVIALAPRLTEGVAPWRAGAAYREAVHGWLRSAADTADQPDQIVYVAVDRNDIIGVVHAAEQTHFTGQVDAYVGELVTASGKERRGVGRALMQAVEAWAAARGLSHLTLHTGAANHSARAFYAALGYLEEDVRLTKKIANGEPDTLA